MLQIDQIAEEQEKQEVIKKIQQILTNVKKVFSANRYICQVVDEIVKQNFALKSCITATSSQYNLFDFLAMELNENTTTEQLRSIIALLTFTIEKTDIKKECANLLLDLIKFKSLDFEFDQEKIILSEKFFHTSGEDDHQLILPDLISLAYSMPTTMVFVLILSVYIRNIGVPRERSLGRLHLAQAYSQLEKIMERIDLANFKDLNIKTSSDDHEDVRANIFLLKSLYQQRQKLKSIGTKPFFSKIIEWGFDRLAKACDGDLEITDAIEPALIAGLKHQCVKFADKHCYLQRFKKIIENSDSLELIDLMAMCAMELDLSHEEKINFIDNFQITTKKRQQTSVNLIKLSMRWRISNSDMVKFLKIWNLDSFIKEINFKEKPKNLTSKFMNDSLFGHIHCDLWLKGTRWEGNIFCNVLGYLVRFFDTYQCSNLLWNHNEILLIALNINYRLQEIRQSLWKTYEIQDRVKMYFYAKHMASSIANCFRKEGYVLIPAGWLDGFGRGHAIMYSFALRDNKNYFMIFNTGSGIEYHMKKEVSGRNLFYNSQVFEIKNTEVLTSLIVELLIPVLEKNVQYMADYVYEKTLPVFAPYMIEVVGIESLARLGSTLIEPQFSGTCAWTVVESWLRSYLILRGGNESAWLDIITQIKYQSYLQYAEIFNESNSVTLLLHARESLYGMSNLTLEEKLHLEKIDTTLRGSGYLGLQENFSEQKIIQPFTRQSVADNSSQLKPVKSLSASLRSIDVVESEKDLIESRISTQKKLADFLDLKNERLMIASTWAEFKDACQNLLQESQFDKAIYWIEQWLTMVDFLASPPSSHDQDNLFQLMQHITDLNGLYVSAIKACNIKLYTKEKTIILWSCVCSYQICNLYLRCFLDTEYVNSLNNACLQAIKKLFTIYHHDQCFVLEQTVASLSVKIEKFLREIKDSASFFDAFGLLANSFRSVCETAGKIVVTQFTCKHPSNRDVLSLLALWQEKVATNFWSHEMMAVHSSEELERISSLFYVIARLNLNLEYCLLYSSKYMVASIEQFILKLIFQEDFSYVKSNHVGVNLSVSIKQVDDLKNIPEKHLIKQIILLYDQWIDISHGGLDDENIISTFLHRHFINFSKEAYLIFRIIVSDDALLKFFAIMDFVREYPLKFLDYHYQSFIFHNLFYDKNFFFEHNTVAVENLFDSLREGLLICQKEHCIDLSILFYLKAIFCLSTINPQAKKLDEMISKIAELICVCLSQPNNSFLLHQLYAFQLLFSWCMFKCSQSSTYDFSSQSSTRIWELILISRYNINQLTYSITEKDEYYSQDELVGKLIHDTEVEIAIYIQDGQFTIELEKLVNILKIVSPNINLTDAYLIDKCKLQVQERILFDCSKSKWIIDSYHERLMPYSITRSIEYRAIFGNQILLTKELTKDNEIAYEINWKGVTYQIASACKSIIREIFFDKMKHTFQLFLPSKRLETLDGHETCAQIIAAIEEITNLVPLVLLEKGNTIWQNTDVGTDVKFVLCTDNSPMWVCYASGEIHAVTLHDEGFSIDRKKLLLPSRNLQSYIPWALDFEHPWYIECIGEKQGDDTIIPTHINFKRYELQLVFNTDKNIWQLNNQPNCVVDVGVRMPVEHFKNFVPFKDLNNNRAFVLVPYLKKMHLEMDEITYTQRACSHGFYIGTLDIFGHTRMCDLGIFFLNRVKKFVELVPTTTLSRSEKFTRFLLSVDTNEIDLQNLENNDMWYLSYIYLSQHQPDKAIELLQALKKKVCFVNIDEYVILKWIFCDMPAQLTKTIDEYKFEQKAHISNPLYVAAKLHALFVFANRWTMCFSRIERENSPNYSLIKQLLVAQDVEFLEKILFTIKDFIRLKTENFTRDSLLLPTHCLMTTSEINIILAFITTYKGQLVQIYVNQLENEKRHLIQQCNKFASTEERLSQGIKKDIIDDRIRQVGAAFRNVDNYLQFHISKYFQSFPKIFAVSNVCDYLDYDKPSVVHGANVTVPIDVAAIITAYESIGKPLREEQKIVLLRCDNSNQLFKLAMNSGKTKFIIPSQAAKCSDGNLLSMIVFPSESFAINSRDFKKTHVEILARTVHEFIFDRDASNQRASNFSCLLTVFQEIIVSKGCVVTTRETLSAIQLTFLELIYYSLSQDEQVEPEIASRINCLREILLLLKERGVFFIDEIDASCDFKKKNLIYPIGKPFNPSKEIFSLVILSYMVLRESEIFASFLENGNGVSKDILDDWGNVFAGIIDALLKNKEIIKLCQQHAGGIFSQEDMRSFLLKEKNLSEKSVYLNTLYDLVHNVLPLALSWYLNIHFGFSHIEKDFIKCHLAIPYRNSNEPNEGSTYSKYLLSLWLTVEAVHVDGIALELLEHILLDFKFKYMLGMIEIATLNSQFQELFPGMEVIHIEKFLQNSSGFHLQFAKQPSLINHCLQHFILPSVQKYSVQLISTPFNFCFQASVIKGFSGTSRCNAFLTPMQSLELTPDSDSLLSTALAVKLTDATLYEADMSCYASVRNKMLETIKGDDRIQSIIDVGGWFRGSSNDRVARDLLEKLPLKFTHIIFFHESKLYALSKYQSELIFLESSNREELESKLCSIDKIFIYIPQLQSRGTDLPQNDNAIGIVTINENLTLIDFHQACMRMRGLFGNQNVCIMIPNALRSKCNNFAELEKLLQKNQQEQIEKDAFYAIIEQMRNHMRQSILDQILCSNDFKEIQNIFNKAQCLFIIKNSLEDSLSIEQTISTKAILENFSQGLIDFYKSIFPDTIEEKINNFTIALKLIIKSKIQFCKESIAVPLKEGSLDNSLMLGGGIDQECQLLMRASGQLAHANEYQKSCEYEKERSEELYSENEKEIKQFMSDARLAAKPYNCSFMDETWSQEDFTALKLNTDSKLRLHNMDFYQLKQFPVVADCDISPNIYVTENYAYTLKIKEPELSKPMVFVLGVVDITSINIIVISLYDAILLSMVREHVFKNEQAEFTSKYIWVETLQSGVMMGKKPIKGHPKFNEMITYLEQVHFCAGDVQYLLKVAKDRKLHWLLMGNIEQKLQALEAIVTRYNSTQIGSLDTFKRIITGYFDNQKSNCLFFSNDLQRSQYSIGSRSGESASQSDKLRRVTFTPDPRAL